MKKETRGAPKGNQNAKKETHKQYVHVFGQRWDVDTGKKILAYLEQEGLTQKQYLSQKVENDILLAGGQKNAK